MQAWATSPCHSVEHAPAASHISSPPAYALLSQTGRALPHPSCRFTGTLHSDWGKKISFPRLRELKLSGNQLTGSLPNWNRAGAWRSLQKLELGQNQFWGGCIATPPHLTAGRLALALTPCLCGLRVRYHQAIHSSRLAVWGLTAFWRMHAAGGLPTNWLGKTRPMRNVEVINLDDNNLGKDENGVALATWCPDEGTLKTGSGWCPVGNPIEGTAASLRTLGLANNALSGGCALCPDSSPGCLHDGSAPAGALL